MFSRDFSFTCTPCVHPPMEWIIPTFFYPAEAGPYLTTPKGWKVELGWVAGRELKSTAVCRVWVPYNIAYIILIPTWLKCSYSWYFILHIDKKWQTKFSRRFSKNCIQRLLMALIQTQSWTLCSQRKSFALMTTKDCTIFQFRQIVVESCCHFSMRHHILRLSFIFVSRYSPTPSTHGSSMRSISNYHH